MTERKIYFGSVGPYLYEDTDDIDDGDGDFAGLKISALTTEQIQITVTPTEINHVLRYEDFLTAILTLESQSYYFGVM